MKVGETSEGLREDDSRPKGIMPPIQDVAKYMSPKEQVKEEVPGKETESGLRCGWSSENPVVGVQRGDCRVIEISVIYSRVWTQTIREIDGEG